jgi:uncharacterized membrane protein YtjA (UPF0391 family)
LHYLNNLDAIINFCKEGTFHKTRSIPAIYVKKAVVRIKIYREVIMLNWALTFLVVAIIAGVFGFTGLAGTAAEMAKILFLVFLVLFVLSLVIPRLRPPV